jgi:hypothetical protein
LRREAKALRQVRTPTPRGRPPPTPTPTPRNFAFCSWRRTGEQIRREALRWHAVQRAGALHDDLREEALREYDESPSSRPAQNQFFVGKPGRGFQINKTLKLVALIRGGFWARSFAFFALPRMPRDQLPRPIPSWRQRIRCYAAIWTPLGASSVLRSKAVAP